MTPATAVTLPPRAGPIDRYFMPANKDVSTTA
jgi:hypothetical protein